MKQKITLLFISIVTIFMMACNSTTIFDEHKDEITEKVKSLTVLWSYASTVADAEEMAAFINDFVEQFGEGSLSYDNVKMYKGPYKSTAKEFLKRYDALEVSFTKPTLRELSESELRTIEADALPSGNQYWCFKEQNSGIHYYAYIDPDNEEDFLLVYDEQDLDNYMDRYSY